MQPNLYLGAGDIPQTFLASFLIWFFLGIVAFIFYRGNGKARQMIALSIVSGIFAWVMSLIVKDIIPNVPRPFKINGYPPLTITIPGNASFPSNHTALAFGVASYVLLKNRKLGLFLLILATLIGLGRIVGNVHFPIDVVGGAILGIFSSLLVDTLQTNLRKRR